MSNTYTQIYVQLVFATKGRDTKITSSIREEVEKYICGIFINKGQKVLAIYANPDHIHIFFSYKNLQITISDLVKVSKTESTNFINEKKLTLNYFSWQKGYGAFSYSKSQKEKVVNYVLNQEAHHRKKTFREEYIEFLNAFEIEFKDEYLFEFYD
ncbi:IS200/IS605 family transposase [Chryseobacterium sp. Leaf394]|uniref:IS200/IS605 family transposase n=1 Tax=Chryseobacterium sp. Leaf394 TaxID=1736361 RepID=UPI0006F5F875|nr:IS200/IS605 family transposase [Chryseobacterium sp. Leaf394]KQS93682.1 transposase [Chryseobacterium sp. Leaf394]